MSFSMDRVYALDTADTGGVLIPLAIIAACVVIIVISVIVRRRQKRRAPDQPTGGVDDLATWQTTFGHDVDRWLDAHEGTLATLAPGGDPGIPADLDAAMAAAADTCPDPGLAAELDGMRRSATATRTALTSGDRPAAEEAHTDYGRHRAGAIGLMAQTD